MSRFPLFSAVHLSCPHHASVLNLRLIWMVFTCVLWIVLYQPPSNFWTEEAMDQIKYRRNGWYVASHITYATHVVIVQNTLYIRKNERHLVSLIPISSASLRKINRCGQPLMLFHFPIGQILRFDEKKITQPNSTLESTIFQEGRHILFQFHLPLIRLSRLSYPAELANRWDDSILYIHWGYNHHWTQLGHRPCPAAVQMPAVFHRKQAGDRTWWP